MVRQSGLGSPKVDRAPTYHITKMGKVIGTKDYKKYGKIDVVFLDYSAPMPVWVVGDIDREPVENDMVIVGYMEGRKDSPYLVGFVRNKAYTSNTIVIGKDYVRFQLPANQKDREGGMLDESKKAQRAYVEITSTKTRIHRPSGAIELEAPTIKLTGSTDVTLTGGSITANGENLSVDNT